MLSYIDNKILYDYNMCQQCGVCESVCPKQAISFEMLDDGTHKVIVDNEKCIRCKRCVKCCPTNKNEDYGEYFKCFPDKQYFLGYNVNNKIRSESSSGGVCKTLIIESLKNNLVDGVYTLRKTNIYPFAEGEFYTQNNIPSYDDIPNSVYHSVMTCQNLKKIQKCRRLIIIGTSCQLRAMSEALKGKAEEVIKVCIFCKQQKTLNSTRFLAKIMRTKISKDKKFSVRYRGQGWQGIVQINKANLPWNRAASIPFGRRLWTVPGCNVCGDPFGTNVEADISLMDPWNIRQSNDLGETLITIHTEKGLTLLKHISNIKLMAQSYESVLPALDLKDIWRKQQLVPFFRKEKYTKITHNAGKAEIRQRKFLRLIVEILPRMPILFYLALSRYLPDFRNKILK